MKKLYLSGLHKLFGQLKLSPSASDIDLLNLKQNNAVVDVTKRIIISLG
jgi:hypothetical protein